MWSLVVKIFICYWIAAGIFIIAYDALPHRQLARQQAIQALESALRFESHSVLAAYESGGCAAARPLMGNSSDRIYLALPNGKILCDADPGFSAERLISGAKDSKAPVEFDQSSSHLLAFAVAAPSGNN